MCNSVKLPRRACVHVGHVARRTTQVRWKKSLFLFASLAHSRTCEPYKREHTLTHLHLRFHTHTRMYTKYLVFMYCPYNTRWKTVSGPEWSHYARALKKPTRRRGRPSQLVRRWHTRRAQREIARGADSSSSVGRRSVAAIPRSHARIATPPLSRDWK